MTMMILSVLALGSAAAHIYADRVGINRYAYVFKPLTMALLLLIALFAASGNLSMYGLAIMVMAWRALERMLQTGNTGATLAFASAVWANGPRGIDLGRYA